MKRIRVGVIGTGFGVRVLHQSAVAVAGCASLVEITGSDGVLTIDAQGGILGARRGES